MPRKPIKNGLQRRQFGRGERRLRGNELTFYLVFLKHKKMIKILQKHNLITESTPEIKKILGEVLLIY